MKKKTVTVLAITHSKRVCDPQPEYIDRMEVRRLVMNAYRAGYNKVKSDYRALKIADRLVYDLRKYATNIIAGSDEVDENDKYILDSCVEYFKLRGNTIDD